MEEDQEQQKHVCKYCNKQFPCGRSLGGHMRSHMRNEKKHKLDKKDSSFINGGGGGSNSNSTNNTDVGYGLRENPKKTWRLSDSVLDDCFIKFEEEEKVCKECGKGFQSWKALCGHMRSHSDRERLFQSGGLEGEEEEEDSWNHLIMDSQSDTETAAPRRRKRSTRAARYNNNKNTTTVTVSSCLSFANASSSVSEIEHEQEEVAMCLMMLSRDVGYWGGLNSLAESSDNNSVVAEVKSNENCNVDQIVKPKKKVKDRKLKCVLLESGDNTQFEHKGVSRTGVQVSNVELKCSEAQVKKDLMKQGDDQTESESGKYNLGKRSVHEASDSIMGEEYWKKMKYDAIDSPSKSKYECQACNKIFHSYQALGGHRASHKRMKGCCTSKIESGDTSIDNKASPVSRTEIKLIKSSPIERERTSCAEASYAATKHKHECPVCHKVFASGQALGGHKRSHVLEVSEARVNQTIVVQNQLPEIRDLLDLNLPAPDEEDTTGATTTTRIGFKPWWLGNNHQHEPAVGMIFN